MDEKMHTITGHPNLRRKTRDAYRDAAQTMPIIGPFLEGEMWAIDNCVETRLGWTIVIGVATTIGVRDVDAAVQGSDALTPEVRLSTRERILRGGMGGLQLVTTARGMVRVTGALADAAPPRRHQEARRSGRPPSRPRRQRLRHRLHDLGQGGPGAGRLGRPPRVRIPGAIGQPSPAGKHGRQERADRIQETEDRIQDTRHTRPHPGVCPRMTQTLADSRRSAGTEP